MCGSSFVVAVHRERHICFIKVTLVFGCWVSEVWIYRSQLDEVAVYTLSVANIVLYMYILGAGMLCCCNWTSLSTVYFIKFTWIVRLCGGMLWVSEVWRYRSWLGVVAMYTLLSAHHALYMYVLGVWKLSCSNWPSWATYMLHKSHFSFRMLSVRGVNISFTTRWGCRLHTISG